MAENRQFSVPQVDEFLFLAPFLMVQVNVNYWCGLCCTGRLTITNYAIYFETAGVLSYGEPKKYDLASDLNYEVSADLTGPWGAKLFDKAIMFKSNEL